MPHESFLTEISFVGAGLFVAALFVALVLLVARRYPQPETTTHVCLLGGCEHLRGRVQQLELFIVANGLTVPEPENKDD